jgi:hypothetical protein
LLPPSKVNQTESIGFRLEIIDNNPKKSEDIPEMSQSIKRSHRKLSE